MTLGSPNPPPFELVHESQLVADVVTCDVCNRDAEVCTQPSRLWMRLEVRETYRPHICTACIMGAANIIGDIIEQADDVVVDDGTKPPVCSPEEARRRTEFAKEELERLKGKGEP